MRESAPAPLKSRWHWMAAASAAGAAGSAQAELVQITQTDNLISFGVDKLDRDLTGDGIDDVEGWTASYRSTFITGGPVGLQTYQVKLLHSSTPIILVDRAKAPRLDLIDLNPISFRTIASAGAFISSSTRYSARLSGVIYSASSSYGPTSVTNLVEIEFDDERINSGNTTTGFVEITASNLSKSDHLIKINRLIFDDEGQGLIGPPALIPYPEWGTVAEPTPTVVDPVVVNRIEKRITKLEEKLERYENARFGRSILGNKRLKRQQRALKRKIRALKARMAAMEG